MLEMLWGLQWIFGVHAAKGATGRVVLRKCLIAIETELGLRVLSHMPSLGLASLGAQRRVYSGVSTPTGRRKETGLGQGRGCAVMQPQERLS